MKKAFVFLFALLLCFAAATALADAPVLTFSMASGFYKKDITLEMHCDDQKAIIYYTLDGSTPDETSLVYEGALSLGESNTREDRLTKITDITGGEIYVPVVDFPTGHIVRAVAISPKGERSAVVSGTYLVGYDRKKLYGDTPIMFLAVDPDGFFNYETGIYAAGKYYDEWKALQTEPWEGWQAVGNFSQRGDEWERPVTVTFLPAEGEGFTQDMGVRIKGGASRGNNQKSLRLIAREEYGEKNVDYVLYPDNVREKDSGVVEKYKSFTLRNGGNDCDFGKIRDPFIANLATGLRFETAQNMPCIAFLNGEFWGMYILNEEYTDNYIQYHYGIDNENVVMVKVGELDEGEEKDFTLFEEMFNFIAENDMSDPKQYEKAAQLLDMGSFADYWALHVYIDNQDGPFHNNNWEMWRVRQPDVKTHPFADGKWRMMLYDTDYSSDVYGDGNSNAADSITPILTGSDYEGWHPALLFNSLMKNEEFKQMFIQACCDVRNIYFSTKRTDAMLKEMTEQYGPYVPLTLERFGPQWTTWNAKKHYADKLKQIGKFFTGRSDRFPGIVKNTFGLGNPISITIKIKGNGAVHLNGRDIPVPHNTKVMYFAEHGLTVTAVPAEGKKFAGWTVSHDSAVLSDPDALTTEVSFQRVFTLTANFK